MVHISDLSKKPLKYGRGCCVAEERNQMVGQKWALHAVLEGFCLEQKGDDFKSSSKGPNRIQSAVILGARSRLVVGFSRPTSH